jgi:hypothetical protein
VFWWTWSLRRRIFVLASVFLPALGALAFFVIAPRFTTAPDVVSAPTTTAATPSPGGASTTVAGETPPETKPQDVGTPVQIGVKVTPTALELLPTTFKAVETGQLRDITLPDSGPNDRSIYVVHLSPDWEELADAYHNNFEAVGATSVLDVGAGSARIKVSGNEGGRRFRADLRVIPGQGITVVVGKVTFLDQL